MIGEARNSSRRWTITTLLAKRVRNVASSIAESPPPTTTTTLSRKNAPSQVAQYETPRPCSVCSDGSPSWRALAPVATITESARCSSFADVHAERALREVDTRDVVRHELGAEPLGLAAEVGHHRRAHHAVGVARVVLDVARDHQLSAPVEALDHERMQVRPRRVERCGVAGGAAADDDHVTNVVHCVLLHDKA